QEDLITNGLNIVNLLQQQNTRLHNVERIQDHVPADITTQIEGIQRSQHYAIHENEDKMNDAQSQLLRNTNSRQQKPTYRCHNGGNGGGRDSPPHDSDDGKCRHTPPPHHRNRGESTQNRHRKKKNSVSPL
ncbi:hypothetical protein A2U01_0052472, partial [Trifolium medium]|nr:hypothetical protein [Trifolium medium]